jgi:copper chaperone
MSEEVFNVQNVKCGGCTSAIENSLAEIDGVSSVIAEIDNGRVTVTGDTLDRALLSAKLQEIGYPENS